MTLFGLFEAKNRLSELVDRAGAGEEVVITKHGRPKARIVAYADATATDDRRKRQARSLERIKALRADLGRKITMADILAGRHEGHKY